MNELETYEPEKTVPKRPISIWITQFLMIVIACGLSLIGVSAIRAGEMTPIMVVFLLSVVVFTALPIIAFFGLAKRRSWGRWVAVVFLSFLDLSALNGLLRADYSNGFKFTGEVGNILPVLLLSWLIFVLAKSDEVDRFFAWKDPAEGVEAPAEA